MRTPTASGLGRALVCEASRVLPIVNTISPEASRGSAVHAFAERAHAIGRDAALAEVDESIRHVCEGLDPALLDPSRLASEVAFAYDANTGTAREIGRGLGRNYGALGPSEIAGTADLVALVGSDAVYVGDLKRSLWALPPAARNAQLGFYALAACRAYGRDRAIVELLPYETDEAPSRAELDAFALDSMTLDLGAFWSRSTIVDAEFRAGTMPTATEGAHCRWCPSFSYCPAKGALARAMGRPSDFLEAIPPHAEGLITTDNASTLWTLRKRAQEVLDRIGEALDLYARQTPITLEDGTVVSVRETRRESIDGDVAHAALAAMNAKLAESVCEWSVTKARIKQAAKRLGLTEDEIMAELRKRGAVKTTTSASVVEKRPRAA